MRIGLLGSTGYTGRLTAATLAAAGHELRLGGRSPERLAAVAEHGEVFVVDVAAEPERLRLFFDGLDVVVSCAGPFEQVGRPVVAAAVAAGVPYVDSTGEPGFLADVYATHAGAATPVVPSCGLDYLPGDLAAAIAADVLGHRPDEVLVGYRLTDQRISRGTASSALGALSTISLRPAEVTLPFPDGRRPGLVLPWGEELTVPRHLPGTRVRTAFAVPAAVAKVGGLLGPLVASPAAARAGAALAPALTPLLARAVAHLPEGPPESARAGSRTEIVAVAYGDGRTAVVQVRCEDTYLLTAQLLTEAAARVPAAPPGALTPAQAFDPRAFLDAVAGPLLAWRVVAEPTDEAARMPA